ncbi:hypothetical protein QAD02_008493 [Eretmocerus hayati]|uniref:Uncharacterized protein n=1 Tax=Eretmocerus hayati TaxID=131215 RepID=A0ACC2N6X4_9HYME|nr:hypothetical protein QAD02_008493 [Eretmocerus hayati]
MLGTESRPSNKLEPTPTRDPWFTMDQDQSLQEMLDCDIKAEIESVIGGNPEFGFTFNEYSPLDLDDDQIGYTDLNWFGSQSLINGNSNGLISNYNLDLSGGDAASIMVNPNSVMPHMSMRNSKTSISGSTATAANTSISSTTTARSTSDALRPFSSTTSSTSSLTTSNSTSRRNGVDNDIGDDENDRGNGSMTMRSATTTTIPMTTTTATTTNGSTTQTQTPRRHFTFGNGSSLQQHQQPRQGLKRRLHPKPSSTPGTPTTATTLLLQPATGTIKTLSPQLASKASVQQQHGTSFKVNGITGIKLQNLKILQQAGPNGTQHIRRQVYGNNNTLQAHVLTNPQSASIVMASQLMPLSNAVDGGASPGANSPSSYHHHKRDKDPNSDPLALDYDTEPDIKPFPKPAYSYSCLIAMALKNSQTGSLPVSEIYNFMCEHFPYFKTAPNGWKNSVRHNLSLNKCFEKIEKPAGNGNQRKGCLWAINPAKVAKMDEEVQKWSRKDPLAIKKAMVFPEQLELLERGEMKYVGSGNASGGELSGDDETESSGDEEELPDEGLLLSTPRRRHSHHHHHQLQLQQQQSHGHQLQGLVAANSVTDSYDESSQDDQDEVDVNGEQIFDDIDIDEEDHELNKQALHMQLNIASSPRTTAGSESDSATSYHHHQLGSPGGNKRQKTLHGTLQANYVYKPVSPAARRKSQPLFLTAGPANGSFLKIE